MIRQSIVFHGRVQGVFFRATACSFASGLGLVGWVRNRDDGTVEMEVEGDAKPVHALLEALRERYGPGIRHVSINEREVVGEESGFRIVN